MPKSGSLEEEAQRLLGQLGEAEASLSAAYAEIAALRATVGGPRFEDLKVPGKDYCRHCGVEIFVPRMNEERLGPLMHRGPHHVPYLQCKMLTVAEWEDGHEEPPKPLVQVAGTLDLTARVQELVNRAQKKVASGLTQDQAVAEVLREDVR